MLSLADTHGIAKYARTYIRDTHTHAHTQKKAERLEIKKIRTQKKRGVVTKERKKKKRKDRKKRGEKKQENERKRRGDKKKDKKKEGGRWVSVGRGAWVIEEGRTSY